jgi:hypothetical protein
VDARVDPSLRAILAPARPHGLKRGRPVHVARGARPMEAILPILIFIVAVIAVNVYEFGRPD